jgi:predicted ester cyclase
VNNSPRRLVERFYHEVWNEADETAAYEILHADFRFRASLGPERVGLAGFLDYMHSIHAALANYECIIDDLIESDTRVATRMRFRGIHRASLFGVSATGHKITWQGAAFFTTNRRLITELWVLGDVDDVKRQLGAAPTSSFTGQD